MSWTNKLAKCENIKCGRVSHCMYLTKDHGWLCDACMDKLREERDAKVQEVCGDDLHSPDGET